MKQNKNNITTYIKNNNIYSKGSGVRQFKQSRSTSSTLYTSKNREPSSPSLFYPLTGIYNLSYGQPITLSEEQSIDFNITTKSNNVETKVCKEPPECDIDKLRDKVTFIYCDGSNELKTTLPTTPTDDDIPVDWKHIRVIAVINSRDTNLVNKFKNYIINSHPEDNICSLYSYINLLDSLSYIDNTPKQYSVVITRCSSKPLTSGRPCINKERFLSGLLSCSVNIEKYDRINRPLDKLLCDLFIRNVDWLTIEPPNINIIPNTIVGFTDRDEIEVIDPVITDFPRMRYNIAKCSNYSDIEYSHTLCVDYDSCEYIEYKNAIKNIFNITEFNFDDDMICTYDCTNRLACGIVGRWVCASSDWPTDGFNIASTQQCFQIIKPSCLLVLHMLKSIDFDFYNFGVSDNKTNACLNLASMLSNLTFATQQQCNIACLSSSSSSNSGSSSTSDLSSSSSSEIYQPAQISACEFGDVETNGLYPYAGINVNNFISFYKNTSDNRIIYYNTSLGGWVIAVFDYSNEDLYDGAILYTLGGEFSVISNQWTPTNPLFAPDGYTTTSSTCS